ncbi:MAG: 3'(2'),5'-bisphosphate nucleotidase CysQ [Gemmataceae bacterium]|nr:3'(2'),5'-bisphosphate nucleotidase CysQ [Gemmataceae bacterium]MCI0739917.1 3'(2'),5'-bisphosphate nucleotidase CysQ [Gemmataceae bacterium]
MYERELEVALQAAELASSYLVEEYEHFEPIPNAPASISTEADRRSQEIILQHLLQHFPDDGLSAEEATETARNAKQSADRLWIVDPIDGTRGFAMKNGEFSVMIAFLHQGKLAVGVVEQPAAQRRTYASLGKGCWRRDQGNAAQQCFVAQTAEFQHATLTQSRSKNPGGRSRWVEALQPGRIVESYSAGIKLALVARAEADVYLNSYEAFHDWDIAAGHLLVQEAGGATTDIDGNELVYGLPGAWQKNGLLATNGKLHVEAVKRAQEARR